jgi:hypothetical protein
MDVIGQAIWFGIQVTWWLIQTVFSISCKLTKLVFETMLSKMFRGALVQSEAVIIVVSALIWTPVLVLFFALTGGNDGLLAGLVIGPIWGVATGMKAISAWGEESAHMQYIQEPEQNTLLDRPLNVVSHEDDDEQKPEIDLSYFDITKQEVPVEDKG